MIYLRRITSLNNLNTNSIKGQIATILILITVAIMIFILTTINLGRVSIKATQVANAADAATLYLASVLASRAHFYYEKLGDRDEYCEKGGFLSVVLSIVAAIIAAVIIIATAGAGTPLVVALKAGIGYIIAASTVAGAIGGYIQTGELKGAGWGAVTGLAVGLSFASGVGIFGSCAFVTSLGLTGTFAELGIAASIGAIASTSITANEAMNLLQDSVDQMAENMDKFYRATAILPEIEQTREAVLLMAFSRVVDDSNMQSDRFDLDDDGLTDTDEPVTAFENWWWERTLRIRGQVTSPNIPIISNFFTNSLMPFTFGDIGIFGAADFVERSDRREVECDCSTSSPKDEGPITDMFRRIEASDYDIFWEPGPNRAKLLTKFYKCTDCVPPKGFDSFDAVRLEYEHFIEFVKKLLHPDNCGNFSPDLEDLEKQLRPPVDPLDPDAEREEIWLNRFYDPDLTTDYYDKLYLIAHGFDRNDNRVLDENDNPVLGIQDWIDELLGVRGQLPGCQLAMGSYIENTNEMVAEYCSDDYPTIYPCNWQRSSVQWDLFPYFPNYACKLYDDILVGGILVQDKNILYNEIGQVRTFVENLTGVVTQISFDGVLHKPGDKTPLGTGKGTITYIEDGKSKTEKLAAPDLFIPNMNKEDFLLALDTFVLILDGTSSTFATIDRDLENEFSEDPNDATGDYVPVIVRLRAEIDAIDNFFLPTLEAFYDNINTGAGVGQRAANGYAKERYTWSAPDCPLKDDNEDGIVPDYDEYGNIIYEDCHYVEVEIGPFRFPYLKKSHHESWLGMVEKDCVTIKKREDDGEYTWVRITRSDSGREKNIASSGIGLGLRWYPGRDTVVIERKSRAKWDHSSVGIGRLWD